MTADGAFTKDVQREGALIEAVGYARAPSAALVGFLEARSGGPESEFDGRVARALGRIRRPETLAILERRFRDEKHDWEVRSAFCLGSLMPYRTDPRVLALYGRLLRAEIGHDSLRDEVVQSLFDYRPYQWFGGPGCYAKDSSPAKWDPLKPPPWEDAATEDLRELAKLADVALALKIKDDTKAAVRQTRKEIEAILAEREAKK